MSSRRTSIDRPARLGSAGERRRVVVDVGGDHVVVDDVGELVEPPQAELRSGSCPCPGSASGSTTSNALIRSLATISSTPVAGVVEVADLAGVDRRRQHGVRSLITLAVLPAARSRRSAGAYACRARCRSEDRRRRVRARVRVRGDDVGDPRDDRRDLRRRRADERLTGRRPARRSRRGSGPSRRSAASRSKRSFSAAPFSRIASATATACSLIASCAVSRPTPRRAAATRTFVVARNGR